MKVIFSMILMGLLFCTCESATHIDKEAVIQEKVQERLSNYKQTIFIKCHKAVLEEASAMADSIILERARLFKNSLPRPLKPIRPDQPTLLDLKDSLNLAPLFETIQPNVASNTLQKF